MMIVIILVLALIVLGFVFWFGRGGRDGTLVETESGEGTEGGQLPDVGSGSGNGGVNNEGLASSGGNGGNSGNEAVEELPRAVSEAEREEKEAETVAIFFVEMLGSYSTDANFQNVIDLYPMMTSKMRSWADDFIRRNATAAGRATEEVDTSVVKSEFLGRGADRIVFLFDTRREHIVNGQSSVYDQGARVVTVREGESWKVDQVDWR